MTITPAELQAMIDELGWLFLVSNAAAFVAGFAVAALGYYGLSYRNELDAFVSDSPLSGAAATGGGANQ